MTHAAFRPGFIWSALMMALLVGFSIGAHLTAVLGLGFGPGRAFASFVQTHGHVQLVGWTGLFIMGISLHVLPRLAGTSIVRSRHLSLILWLMTAGLICRTLGHTVLPYLTQGIWLVVMQATVLVSAGLELAGISLYVTLIAQAMAGGRASARPPVMAIAPFVGSMLCGWVGYATLNAWLLAVMVWNQQVVVEPHWNQVAIQMFIGLTLLPVAFAFSVRLLPLYLRLRVPTWSVRRAAFAYLLGWVCETVPMLPPMMQAMPRVWGWGAQVGMGLKGSAVLWIVWKLGVLGYISSHCTRLTASGATPESVRGRLTPRATHLFGRFDWLIVSAYIWLALGAFCDVIIAITNLLNFNLGISPDAVRHLYLLGFISLLIFGIGGRLLPGLLQARQVASPGLVTATFWLGNATVLCRILLVGVPPRVWQAIPSVVDGVRLAFAFSGILGMVAIFCLWLNLRRTARAAMTA